MGKTCVICGKDTGSNTPICDTCTDRVNDRMHNPEPGKCPVCGNELPRTGNNNSKYCSPDCYEISIKINHKIWQKNHKKNHKKNHVKHLPQVIVPRHTTKKRTAKRKSRLDENALKAREMGLSYGMYMARYRSDSV